MNVIQTRAAMHAWAEEQGRAGKRIVLVPTMGYFHEGHLSLMRLAGVQGDVVVTSLFVNPMQFGPGEDLASYPRNFEQDCAMADSVGVDVVFAPGPADMYPDDFQTVVSVRNISRHLCGTARPGHFDGVATVLVKLFHMTRADSAVFGEKDYQQLAVIRRMVADLNMDIEIVGHPIVREKDGLAMSSRNSYLDEEERRTALCLYKSLIMARRDAADGIFDTGTLAGMIREYILSFSGTEIDYVSFVDSMTLEPHETVMENTLLTLAVRINKKVRLIDNGLVLRSSGPESVVLDV